MRKSLVGKAATQPLRLLIWDFKVHVEDCQTLGKLGQIWQTFQCPQADSTLVVFLKRHENLMRNKGTLSHQKGWLVPEVPSQYGHGLRRPQSFEVC